MRIKKGFFRSIKRVERNPSWRVNTASNAAEMTATAPMANAENSGARAGLTQWNRGGVGHFFFFFLHTKQRKWRRRRRSFLARKKIVQKILVDFFFKTARNIFGGNSGWQNLFTKNLPGAKLSSPRKQDRARGEELQWGWGQLWLQCQTLEMQQPRQRTPMAGRCGGGLRTDANHDAKQWAIICWSFLIHNFISM